MAESNAKRRVGVIGYGKLGQFLVNAVVTKPELNLELAFIWNRSSHIVEEAGYKEHYINDITQVAAKKPDLIIEVAHKSITDLYGAELIKICDYMVGSPTCFADAKVEKTVRDALTTTSNGLYIPSGALWGSLDLLKMGERGTLTALKVTMKKHPDMLKVLGELKDKNEKAKSASGPVTIYEGPVRDLCPLAPNNVNTMACAAMAAKDLGFDKVVGCLVSDPTLEAHVVEINAVGPGDPPFTVNTIRFNPAKPGAVTGNATYNSFLSSMVGAVGQGKGLHFC